MRKNAQNEQRNKIKRLFHGAQRASEIAHHSQNKWDITADQGLTLLSKSEEEIIVMTVVDYYVQICQVFQRYQWLDAALTNKTNTRDERNDPATKITLDGYSQCNTKDQKSFIGYRIMLYLIKSVLGYMEHIL